MPRGVPGARSSAEIELLIGIVSKHIQDLECPGRDAFSRQRKTDAWNSVEKDFNSSKQRSRRATRHELQLLWNSLKNKTRRQRKSVGPNAPLSNRLTAAVERVLKENGKTPPQSEEESTTESDEENPENDAFSFGNGIQPPSIRSPTVDYCPRRQFLTAAPDNGAQSSFSPLPIPEGPRRSAFTPCPSPRPLYHGPAVTQPCPQNTFRPIGTVNTPVQSPSVVSSTPNSFLPQGLGPRYFTVYAPPISSMGSSGSLPRAPFRTPVSTVPTVQQHPIAAPTPVSPLRIDNTSRMHYLQEAQTHIRIKHIQALAAMEKTLHENKIRTEEMLANWAKELHEMKMHSNAVPRGNEVMDQFLQKRHEELHSAKMRLEEINASKQRELYDIKIETAKIERDLAEINKRIIELKLEQAELELQYFKENSLRSSARTTV